MGKPYGKSLLRSPSYQMRPNTLEIPKKLSPTPQIFRYLNSSYTFPIDNKYKTENKYPRTN